MSMQQFLYVIVFTFLSGCGDESVSLQKKSSKPIQTVSAGLRASNYGAVGGFPQREYWGKSVTNMAKNFEAKPTILWIVGGIEWSEEEETFTTKTYLDFPGSSADTNITFQSKDLHEEYLDYFDKEGIEVWLQVESSHAEMEELIDLVLQRYGSHPCVKGFGVDVEWYLWTKENEYGGVVTDSAAQKWLTQIQHYNPKYKLFLKHWETDQMPLTVRKGIVFINDGQNYGSLEELTAAYKEWGSFFGEGLVGFQYGYESDEKWWKKYKNPPQFIGNHLLETIPNTSELFWVDFTMHKMWKR